MKSFRDIAKSLMFPESVLSFLRRSIIDTKFLFIDYWSIFHFFSGAALALFVSNLLVGFGIIIGAEIFERILMSMGIIRPETIVDTIWDIIITFGGFLLVRRFVFKDKIF